MNKSETEYLERKYKEAKTLWKSTKSIKGLNIPEKLDIIINVLSFQLEQDIEDIETLLYGANSE